MLTNQQKDRLRKHQEWLGRNMAEKTLFASVYGGDSKVQSYSHTGKLKSVTFDQAKAVERAVLKWRVSCYALCRDTTGRDYLKSMCINLKEPVRQDWINQALSRAHFDFMMTECNMNHVLTLSWLATTGPEPTDEVAMKIFSPAFSQFNPVTVESHGVFKTNPRGDE